MADIKVKESKKGTIKTINKAVVGTQKIKNNVLDKNKEITENNRQEENISATEYAIEKSKNAIKNVANATKQANKIGLQSFKQTRQNLQKLQNDRKIKQEAENYPNMQNIYRRNKTNKLQENYKTNTQKSNVKKNIKIKNVTNNPIKTTKYTKGTIKGTIKSSKNPNKNTIKTAEGTGKNIKNTAKTTIKNTRKAIQVAKETVVKTAKGVKAISKAIATTVKATVTGTKAVISAIVAGGWIIILIIVLLLSITALLYNTGENSDIVTVALSQVGNVGGEPYWSWYGFKERVEWCACFVSYCANECGYIEKGIIPKFAGCESEGVSWFKTKKLWQEGGVIPRPGYIVFFDWKDKHDGKADHVRNCTEI